jgi:eukaryotic-like serine/threonine-protein kinase
MDPQPATRIETEPEEDRLEALLIRVLEEAETDGVRAFERACDSSPDLASGLRRRWRELERMGLLSDQPLPEIPERLGEFRIVRRLGGGGMGVVYLAVQESLGREVALKLVRPDQMVLSGARERFLREVQIVARLQHPGIVPIYTFGKANGIAYFAMERVRGASLEQALAVLKGREPATLEGADLGRALQAAMAEDERGEALADGLYGGTWEQCVLRVFRFAAEALEHVHGRGVLHRDLKPSNIMLTPGGRVMLLDFGLARGSQDANLTRSQAQLGSLHYYPPELLAHGPSGVDARADVYSLGVSLYQALCLRTPFIAASAPATVVAITHGGAEPPRRHNPALSWECETVCLAALETERERRYASAAQFARDLANVLEHRPLEARRAGVARRARSWAQRHPARAVGLALGSLLVVAGPIGWALSERAARGELGRAFERSERHFTAALQAVGHVLRETAVTELEDVPRMQQARLAALDRAFALFPDLERDRPDDPRVWSERAALRSARGKVLRDIGRPEEALAEFEREIADRRMLLARETTAERARELSSAVHEAGKAFAALRRFDLGVAYHDESVELRRELIAREPGAERARYDLSGALADRSETLRALGRFDEGARDLDEALAIAQALRAQFPAKPDHAWLEGRVEDDLSMYHNNADRLELAREHAERGLAARRVAAELAPERRFYACDVASSLWMLANCQSQLRDSAGADQNLDEAERILSGLVRDFPDSSRYRSLLGQVQETRGMVRLYRGRSDEGLPLLELALADLERLVAAQPGRVDHAIAAARVSANVAAALNSIGRDSERVLVEVARSDRLHELADRPGAPRDLLDEQRASLLHTKIIALCRLGRTAEVPAEIERRLALRRDSAWNLRLCADEWNELYVALRAKGAADAPRDAEQQQTVDEFLAALERAVAAGYSGLGELEGNPTLDPFRAEPRFSAVLEGLRSAAAAKDADK